MPYPSIAIVGRPNVGKSTLFNRLVGSRIAIEAPVAGVTRDRILYPLTIDTRTFDLIDTGGIGVVDSQHLEAFVETQIERAISEASAILFLVDSRDGVTPLDQEVAQRLRRAGCPVQLVATKVDTRQIEEMLPSFHELGFGDALPVSAVERRNLDDLEEAILALLPPPDGAELPHPLADWLKIGFVGKRNVGKSSIINHLCGDERCIVSDTPGTTRDSLDIAIERDGRRFVAIDTAGMRRRAQQDDVMEFYGHVRSERAIRRADAVVLMLDATAEISKVDKQLGARIVEAHKPCIIALNKWDLVLAQRPDVKVEDFQAYVADNLPGLYFCRMAGVSALSGQTVWPLVDSAFNLAKQAAQEVRTSAINGVLGDAQRKRRPAPYQGKVGKIYYGTQVGVSPPHFILFVNNPKSFDDNYRRFLARQFREQLGYPDVPVQITFKMAAEKELGRYTG